MRVASGSRGFSLLEISVAVALLGILAMLARNPISRYLQRVEFNNSVKNIKHLIQTCQSRAMANPNVHLGVHFDDERQRAFAFEDRTSPALYQYDGAADPGYLQPVVLERGVRFEKLAGYPDEIIFRGDGSAYKSLRIVVTDGILEDTLDVLASTGRVRVGR